MGETKKIIEENRNSIITLYNQGMLQREIAEVYNVSKSAVARLLHSAGIINKIVLTEDDELMICKLYKSGKTQEQVAKIYGIGTQRVSRILKDNGVHIRQMSELNHKYTLNEGYFDNIDSQDKAYLLGLLFADGNHYGNSITISLQEKDKDILEKFNSCIGSNRSLKFINYSAKSSNWQDQYMLQIINKHMSEALNNYGLIENKSLSLVFPEHLNKDLYRHLIRGIFDGDGFISKNKKEARVTIISTEQMCREMAKIVEEELGIHVGISLCHRRTDVTTRTFRISGRNQIVKFLDYIYDDANLFLERKYNVYKTVWKDDNINNSLSA